MSIYRTSSTYNQLYAFYSPFSSMVLLPKTYLINEYERQKNLSDNSKIHAASEILPGLGSQAP
jgi:hypothetical protein